MAEKEEMGQTVIKMWYMYVNYFNKWQFEARQNV